MGEVWYRITANAQRDGYPPFVYQDREKTQCGLNVLAR
jgi:hypothetical protein